MRKYIPLVLFIFSWPVLSADIHGRVVRVLDGDTIEVMDSRKAVRIRLVNIDAPEKKQDYGRWSTDMMKSLVVGKTVTVTYFQRDRYGRILGQVYGKRLVRTVLIFTESSDQLSRATDRVPGLPASPGYVQ